MEVNISTNEIIHILLSSTWEMNTFLYLCNLCGELFIYMKNNDIRCFKEKILHVIKYISEEDFAGLIRICLQMYIQT